MDNLSEENNMSDSSAEVTFVPKQKVLEIHSNVDIKENKTMSEKVLDDLLNGEEVLLDRPDDVSINLQHQTKDRPLKNNDEQNIIIKTYNDVASSPIVPNESCRNDIHGTSNNLTIISPFLKVVDESSNLDKVSLLQVEKQQEGEESQLPKVKMNLFSNIFNTFQEQLLPEVSKDNTSSEIDAVKVKYLELKSFSKQDCLSDSNNESIVSNSSSSNSTFYTSQQDSSENEKVDFENKADNAFEYKLLNSETHLERSEIKDCNFEVMPSKNTPEKSNQDNNQNYNEKSTKEISDKNIVDTFPKIVNDNSLTYKEISLVENSSIVPKKDVFSVSSGHKIRPNRSTNMFNTYPSYKRKESISIETIGINKPSEEVSSKIISNVEFYFTDFNIFKNNFLLKHIRKNKGGYVSLKLITSFRKVKAVTRDWRVVAYCMEDSKLLELNSEKNKVRRIEPVPKIEDTSFGKTIVIFNLPFLKPSNENLKELFSKFGPVVNAEIMTNKSKSFNIYHKKCLFFNQDVASKIFGLIEFENYKDLQSALKDEEGYLPKQNNMNVVPLVTKYFGSKGRNFRYKSEFSYPRNSAARFTQQRSRYFRDIYSSYAPNDIKSNKSYSSEENIPRRNYSYLANQERWYYPPRDLPNCYLNQNCCYYSQAAAVYDKMYAVGGQRASENWRQNRQLKSNTSMNIESRMMPSIRKIGAFSSKKENR